MQLPSAQFFVARAPNLADAYFESLSAGGQTLFRVVEDDTDAILAAANVVLTASGTATVQTALHGTPMVIVYRVSPLTYRLLRRLVRVEHLVSYTLGHSHGGIETSRRRLCRCPSWFEKCFHSPT